MGPEEGAGLRVLDRRGAATGEQAMVARRRLCGFQTPLDGPSFVPLGLVRRAAARERTPSPQHNASVGSIAPASPAGLHITRHDVCPPVRQRGGRGAGIPLSFTAPAAVQVRGNYRRVPRQHLTFSPTAGGPGLIKSCKLMN